MSAASAKGDVVFTDLGPAGNVYDGSKGFAVSGARYGNFTTANLFTASGEGNFAVSEIDLAVLVAADVNTFYASIWTDSIGTPRAEDPVAYWTGMPRAEVPGAYWSLSTNNFAASCCGLISITGITGVHLTGGQSYFLVLGPLSTADASFEVFAANTQGVSSLELFSTDGGSTWSSNGGEFIGAFDVIGAATPEPGYVLLVGIGVAGIMVARRRRSRSQERSAPSAWIAN